jgi:radical SAM protein with 4Fe4S-binding SPASM domain
MATQYEISPDFPERLHIQTISYCNAQCLFCAYPRVADKISHGIMDDAVYKKIIDEAAQYKLKRIALLLMNEPLLDKKLPERIAYAKSKLGESTEITITSNGSILTQKIIDKLIYSGLDRIKISIQGLTKDTYEQIMGLNYQQTFDGINRLIDTLEKRNIKKPKVVLSMVSVGQNEDEIRKYKRYWRKREIKATTVAYENKGGNIEDNVDLHPFGLKPTKRCYRFNRCAYILYNGDVILCCSDWSRSVVLGNVKEKTIKEIFHSEQLDSIRNNFREGNYTALPPVCQGCKKTRLPRSSHRTLKGIYQKFLSYFQDQRRM